MSDQAKSRHFFCFYPMLIFDGCQKYEGLGNIDNDLYVCGDSHHQRPHFGQDLGQRNESDGIYPRICSDLGVLLVGNTMMAERPSFILQSALKTPDRKKAFETLGRCGHILDSAES